MVAILRGENIEIRICLQCDMEHEALQDRDADNLVIEALELMWRLNGERCLHIEGDVDATDTD